MALGQNTYEVPPEKLKELVRDSSPDQGHRLQNVTSREKLMREHEEQLNLFSTGNVPVRSFVLPLPYPPSPRSVRDSNCQKIRLRDLLIEERSPDAVIVLRTFATPYIYSATVTVAEDEYGVCTRLTICNQEDSHIEPLFPEGVVVAVKQACWSRLLGGTHHVQVDHPSDIEILRPNDELVPDMWRKSEVTEDMKNAKTLADEGDTMFLKKRFRRALDCYDRALIALTQSDLPERASAVDIYRKKCGVNIVLLRLEEAADDLTAAIEVQTSSSTSGHADSPILEKDAIRAWLLNHSQDDPYQIATHISRPLQQLASRIKYDIGINQTSPEYDLPRISNYVGPLALHVDAANYICDTEVRQTASHGRGLFATRAFKTGDLVCAEKAFVMPGYFINDRNSDCLLYSLSDETASPRPGALLFKELVQKLRWNPSLRKDYFELDDGGYSKSHALGLSNNGETLVDVFRIEKIRQLNCFSVPTRSLDLLHKSPHSKPELRNGMWIHAAYVNHSCLPNTARTFMGDIYFLRATRDIEAGEELTQQYVSPEIDIEARQDKYSSVWGFECDCKLCEVDGAVPEERRKQRTECFEELKSAAVRLGQVEMSNTAIKKIARGLRELEALYSPLEGSTAEDPYEKLPRLALVHPTLFLTEAWKGVGNADRTIEYGLKLLRNFGIRANIVEGKFEVQHDTGLINVETVRVLKYLADAYRKKGLDGLAEQCLEIARVWFVIITGSDVGADEFFKA